MSNRDKEHRDKTMKYMLGRWGCIYKDGDGIEHKQTFIFRDFEGELRLLDEVDGKETELRWTTFTFLVGSWVILDGNNDKILYVAKADVDTLYLGEANSRCVGDSKWERQFSKID